MAQLKKTSLKPEFDWDAFKDAEGRMDWQAHYRATDEWVEKIQREAREKKEGDVVGTIMRYPRADGYAQYLVVSQKPLMLQHLEIMDAWHADYTSIRGTRIDDVRAQVERNKLFAKR